MKTQKLVIKSAMLLTIDLVVFTLLNTAGWGQGFSPVHYNFPDNVGRNSKGFTEFGGQSPVLRRFGVQSAASNGYGTWIVTRDGGWALLGDTLHNETVDNLLPPPVDEPGPSGVIASGLIPNAPSNEIKVAANLNGSVRYVWFSQYSQNGQTVWGINIAGFDDHNNQPGQVGPYPTHNINNIADLTGLPNSGSYSKICNSIHDPIKFELFQEKTSGNWTSIDYGATDETDWRDKFDIAMDSKFLYLTFSCKDLGPSYKVFLIVFDLVTWAPLETLTINNETHPKLFQLNGTINNNTITTSDGRRPTITANVRNNSTPLCDLAWIVYDQDAGHSGANPFFKNVDIATVAFSTANSYSILGVLETGTELDLGSGKKIYNFWDPADIGGQSHAADFYFNPSHARIIDGSVSTSSIKPAKGLYVIGDNSGVPDEGLWMVFYPISKDASGAYQLPKSPATQDHGHRRCGYRIDGIFLSQNAQLLSPFDVKYNNNTLYLPYYIVDEPIVAFANPYDGNSNNDGNDYNEFHCLYEIIANSGKQDDHDPKRLLRIVNGGILGPVLNRFRGNANESWQRLNSAVKQASGFPNPTYAASVNQMGIHTYWDQGDQTQTNSGNDHIWFYKRDLRFFDEPIEEMTLATNFNVVGSSHQGSTPATILPDRSMLLWTDPNFNSGALYARASGSADHWNNAQLFFKGANATLFVGNNTATSTTNNLATLILPPNFEAQFDGSSNQSITCTPKSKIDFYGVSNETEQFFGKGSLILIGADPTMAEVDATNHRGNRPTLLNSPAQLIIHGGATLRIGDNITLSATGSQIQGVLEQSVATIMTNPPEKFGFIDIKGTGVFEKSLLTGNTASGNISTQTSANGKLFELIACKPLANPIGTDPYSSVPQTQLSLTNCLVSCPNLNSRIEIGCNVNTTWQTSIASDPGSNHTTPLDGGNKRIFSVSGGEFTNATFYVANPVPVTDDLVVSIKDAAFNKVRNFGLYLFRSSINTDDYHDIFIDNCWFHDGSAGQNPNVALHQIPLQIENYTQPLQYTVTLQSGVHEIHNRINIWNSDFGGGESAISLVNSNVAVAKNIITSYSNGILATKGDAAGDPVAQSFLCSDNISNSGNGILADHWGGYIKLNTISGCDAGVHIKDKSEGDLIFSNISQCNNQGVFVEGSSNALVAKLDMSGVHGGDDNNDYEACNTIQQNNVTAAGSNSTGQVEVGQNGKLRIGKITGFTLYGHNNFIGRGGNDNLIFHSGTSVSIGLDALSGDNNLDLNFWKDNNGIIPASNITSDNYPVKGITFNSVITENRATNYAFENVVCSGGIPSDGGGGSGGGGAIIIGKGTSTILSKFDTDRCSDLYIKYQVKYGLGQPQKAYDTAKLYIETCYPYENSYQTFSSMDGYNGQRSTDIHRFEEYREWLKKVLYLNTDTPYYCSDVVSILSTFQWFNNTRGADYPGALAVLYYIRESNKCPDLNAYIDTNLIPSNWRGYHSLWIDTVKDSIATPFDSTLPSIDELGLGILRGKSGVVNPGSTSVRGLGKLTASKNPFSDESTLEMTISDAMMLRLEIYDILGKQVYTENEFFSPGDVRWKLDGKLLPKGSLYARVSTIGGVVRTVKLVRE